MSSDSNEAPISVRGVGWVLAATGAVYVIFAVIGLVSVVRSEAFVVTTMLALGVGCLIAGTGLLLDRRWAYRAAIALLAAAIAVVVVRVVLEADRSLVSQVVVPAIALWILLRPEPRAHFARPN